MAPETVGKNSAHPTRQRSPKLTYRVARVLSNGFSEALGFAFNPAVFGTNEDGDLAFNVGLTDGSLLSANVVYITGGGIPGDYNGDGSVDAADYTVWRDTFGAMGADLPADGNGDMVVDSLDYDLVAGELREHDRGSQCRSSRRARARCATDSRNCRHVVHSGLPRSELAVGFEVATRDLQARCWFPGSRARRSAAGGGGSP